MVLADLKTGEEAVIVKVKGYGAFRKRLNEMGFIRGKVVKAIKNAPLRDPIEYAIMGYEVSLRRQEAAFVEIVSLQEAAGVVGIRGELQEVVEVFAGQWKVRDKNIHVALVGNPNAGKTTLFNYASGASERVGNYGGVTVEAKEARVRFGGYRFTIVDLPGTYSLSAYSSEERFVREYIASRAPDVVVNVVDASNLERNLYLSTQLIDMDVRTVIALNMFDEMERSGAEFDYRAMGKMIGMPIVPTVAARGKGIKELLQEIIEVHEGRSEYTRHVHVHYGNDVEEGIAAIRANLEREQDLVAGISPRFLALKLLEKDAEALRLVDRGGSERLREVCREQAERLEALHDEPVEATLTDARYGFISGALKETYREPKGNRNGRSLYIDSLLTHRFLGIPLFLFFLAVTFCATFILGKFPMDWIDDKVSLLGAFVKSVMQEGPLESLLVDGIIRGVGSVIIFLPNILILFFFISFMEDTGYMARAVFIMDKLMHKIGLHGKSFIPLVMGFGCNVPAIMATRVLENRGDRLLTILINPFMSCNARLPVYTLLAPAFFPGYPALVLLGVYVTGILVAIVFGKIFKKLLFNKQEAPFVMELPPYRMPTARSTVLHMWHKSKQYLKKMGGLVMLVTILIWALGYFPVDKEREERHERAINEIARQEEINAPRREAAILALQRERQLASRLDIPLPPDARTIWDAREFDRLVALGYFPVDSASAARRERERDAIDRQALSLENALLALQHEHAIERQANSYLARVGKSMAPAWDPLGFDWRAGVSLLAGWAAKEVVISTMSVLYLGEEVDEGNNKKLGDRLHATYTPRFAILFMLFVLLYSPCFTAILAICKEANWKWGAFVMGYTTALAWGACYLLKTILDWIS
ncbi:MAG: ferrous iron transport protein B [Odoribacteraceae bacterium]|jgi:ferrous iron transport protein B|nr:ferrous iron transport protein B [Odoribacteraceae bacterium]